MFTERSTGRKYQLVKVFVATGGKQLEAATGRQYNIVKRYV
jgi:hypothetical protein